MLALPAALLVIPLAGAAPTSSAGFAVSVTASPATGTMPVDVTLSATVSSGAPVSVTWTFGDGTTYSGAGVGAMTITHEFHTSGTYTVSALVTESTGSATGSVAVAVIPGPLAVVIGATPLNGTVPFTVTYHAVISGGTGTYTQFTWGFGDGGYGAGPIVQYTYRYAGHFTVTLKVVDSANDTASAAASVVASAPAGPTPSSTSSPLSPATVLATAGVVGVAGLTWGVYRVRGRRRSSDRYDPDGDSVIALPAGIGDSVPSAPTPVVLLPASIPALTAVVAAPAGEEASSSAVPAAADSAGVASPSSVSTGIPSFASFVPATPAPSPSPSPASPSEEPKRWSREIVAYLGGLPTLGPDDIPTLDWTQKGMSERLSTGQNQVSNVLRRLVAAGVVIEELQHVQGQPRRLKVYRLSMRGEALAREIRRRRVGQNPNFLSRDW